MNFLNDGNKRILAIGAVVFLSFIALLGMSKSGDSQAAQETVSADASGQLVQGEDLDVSGADIVSEEENATGPESADTAQDAADTAAQETGQPEEVQETPEEDDAQDEDDMEEYKNLAIAKVTDYVNVRTGPNTDSEIVGKMYDGSVAQILSTAGENDEWFQVVSGNVEGYIKAEFFIHGNDAAEVIDQYTKHYAEVKADRLNVREKPDITSNRIGYIDHGERVDLIEWGDEWSKVKYTSEHTGYVASQYITAVEEFIYAKSIEEEKAELAALQELLARTQQSAQETPERAVITTPPPQTNFESVSELRTAIVNYAMQYLGNRYINGGQSLANGTDCSGFTCYVYAAFGYSISRTPQGQLASAGRSIDMSQIQPGDIICYTSNGTSCTHVAMYIGNGQIIHAANSRKGVIISNYDYNTRILGVKNVVD